MAFQAHVEEPFIGAGIIYLNGRDVGNVSAANIAYEIDKKALPNYRGGGGNLSTLERISNMTMGLTLTSLNAQNLALALSATVSDLTAASVVDEEHTVANINGLVRVDTMIDTTQAVIVKDNLDATINEVEGDGTVNYTITAAGIIPTDSGAIADSDVIKISYEVPAGYILEAALAFGSEYSVVVDGLNDVNGKPRLLDVYRWKPSPSGFDLLSDDYASMEVSGDILVDTTKGTGKSKFFRNIVKA